MISLGKSFGALRLGAGAWMQQAARLTPSLAQTGCIPPIARHAAAVRQANVMQSRKVSMFNPQQVGRRKAFKGKVKVTFSDKGSRIAWGQYGLRLLEPTRLTGEQLTAAFNAIRRRIRTVKESRIFLRVYPDIPVTKKGPEARMGKGKGSLDHWMCRVPQGRIVMEVSGPNLTKKLAEHAIKLGSVRLPVRCAFVDKDNDNGWLGNKKIPMSVPKPTAEEPVAESSETPKST